MFFDLFKKVSKRLAGGIKKPSASQLSFPDSLKAVFSGKSALYSRESGRDILFIVIVCISVGIIMIIPAGFENSGVQSNAVRCKAQIIHVDNEFLTTIGPVKYGHQKLEIKIAGGRFRGNI